MPGTAHYAASKSGLNGLIRTAALEFARENITVNGVEPGYILTPAMAALGSEAEIAEMAKCIPLGKLGSPLDIANTMPSWLRLKQRTSPGRRSWWTVGQRFRGVDIVDDTNAFRKVAPTLARKIVNGLRAEGVLVSRTGPCDNVLKIRPPMPFSMANADQLVQTLESVLQRVHH